MQRRTLTLALSGASALLLALAGCGGAGSADGSAASDDSGTGESTTLTVFAAASLTDTYEELADRFSQQHDGVDVQLSFAGSSDLVTQIQEGAPADVIATADERTMEELVEADALAADPQIVVSNTLVIAVPTGTPEGIEDLASLADPDLDVVVCAPQVPCGAATETVEEAGGVTLTPASEEPAVTDVLGKVANGQADAGLVYRTDASGSQDVDAIEFDESADAVNLYPIAPVQGSPDADLAQAFVDFILSGDARRVFDDAGFAAP
jgi:molybdate transport system substrate-binding protein